MRKTVLIVAVLAGIVCSPKPYLTNADGQTSSSSEEPVDVTSAYNQKDYHVYDIEFKAERVHKQVVVGKQVVAQQQAEAKAQAERAAAVKAQQEATAKANAQAKSQVATNTIKQVTQNTAQTAQPQQQQQTSGTSYGTFRITFYDPVALGASSMPGGMYSGVAAALSVFPKGTRLKIEMSNGVTLYRTVNDTGGFAYSNSRQLDVAYPTSQIPSAGVLSAKVTKLN